MTSPLPQGGLPVERLCALAGVSRAGYYRHWQASAPRQEEVAVRDAIQRVALDHRRYYGYRRIAAALRREGLAVNRKRVLRLMREDNLLCLRTRPFVPATTDSRHGWHVVPNLARGMVPSGLDQLWVADITYIRLAPFDFAQDEGSSPTSPWCSTRSAAGSSAGRSRRTCRQASRSPRSTWRSRVKSRAIMTP